MKKTLFGCGFQMMFMLFTITSFAPSAEVIAQNIPEEVPENIDEMVVVADVNFDRAEIIEKDNEKININFVLSNSGSAQSDIKYAVQLLETKESGTIAVADEMIYDEILSINGGNEISKLTTYQIPKYLKNGTYKIMLMSQNTSGLILGMYDLGEINIENKAENTILVDNCSLSIDNETYLMNEGIDILPEEEMTVQCDLHNDSSEDITVTPILKTYLRSSFGELAKEDSQPLTLIEKNTTKTIKAIIAKPELPQSYSSKLILLNENKKQISNEIPFHYVLKGESATIQNIRLDKNNYVKGDVAKVSFYWSGAADNFLNSRLEKTDFAGATMEISIKDKKGKECINQLETQKLDTTNYFIEMSVDIVKDCSEPIVDVAIKNNDGNILHKKDVQFNDKSSTTDVVVANLTNDQEVNYKLFILIALVVIIGVAILMKKKHKGKGSNLILFLILGLSSFGSYNSADAKTVCGGTNNVCVNYSVNVNSTSCSVSMPVSVTVSSCGNYTYFGSVSVSGVINGKSNYGTLDGSGGAAYIGTFNSGKLTPGNYPLNFSVTVKQNCKRKGGSDDCTKDKNRSFSFSTTVNIPTCAPPCTPSCSNPNNYCSNQNVPGSCGAKCGKGTKTATCNNPADYCTNQTVPGTCGKSCGSGTKPVTCEDPEAYCSYEKVPGTCGKDCGVGKKETEGTNACEALETPECGDLSDPNYANNWAGTWDEFDRIQDSDWQDNGTGWCNDGPNGGNDTCWTKECHRIPKCTSIACALGGDGRLCEVENNQFVWADKTGERQKWCTDKSTPAEACKVKCKTDKAILARVDGRSPNVIPVDENDNIITTTDGNVGQDNLVATAGQLIANTTDTDEIWYKAPVLVKPKCEDSKLSKDPMIFKCNLSGQGCDTSFSYQSAEACFGDIVDGNGTCKEIEQYASGCDDASKEEVTVTNNGTSATVKQSDRAGNSGEATTVPINIDYNKPEIDGLEIYISTLGFDNYVGDKTMMLYPTPDPTQTLVAHDQYQITIKAEDSKKQTSPDGASTSGISGIDWAKLKLIIGNETINLDNGIFENDQLKVNFSGTDFQSAGIKNIDFEIFDKAGNVLKTKDEGSSISFEVGAGIAEKVTVTDTNCSQVIADNKDVCDVTVKISDKFDNPVTGRDVKLKSVTSNNVTQDTNGSYDLSENADQAFLNGVRMKLLDGDINNSNEITLKIRSLVPTLALEKLPNNAGGDDIIKVTDNDEEEGVIEKYVQLLLDVQKINGVSEKQDSYSEIAESDDIALKFYPWVAIKLTDKENCLEEVNNPMEISLGDEKLDVNICAKPGMKGGIDGKDLPPSFDVQVIGHSPAETNFLSEDIDYDVTNKMGLTKKFTVGINQGSTNQSFSTALQAGESGDTGDLTDIAITSIVSVPVYERDDDGNILVTARTIVYPNGNIGPEGFEAYLVGADIEGGILGESYNYDAETEVVKMGGVSATDIREELTSNAFQLIRGLTSETTRKLSNPNFSSKKVLYFKGGTPVELKGKISGVGTIIIEDGNLVISNDLSYNSAQDSLGVILINSQTTQANTTPNNGNIFISPMVQKVVGTYFADGSLQSGTPTTTIDYQDTGDYKSKLTKQLILEGTIFTKNTLGGSLGEKSGNLFTSWGTADLPTARRYDLHFIRRYKKSNTNIMDTQCKNNPDASDLVVCNKNCVESKAQSGKCDRNPHAFVIRPDGRVKTSPPPGFSNMGSIK